MSRPLPFFEQNQSLNQETSDTPTRPRSQITGTGDNDNDDGDPLIWLTDSSQAEDWSNSSSNNDNSNNNSLQAADIHPPADTHPPNEATQQQRNTAEENAATAESCWQTISTTPMTSRPHFRARWRSFDENENNNNDDDDNAPRYPLRRVRSRSLGSSPAPAFAPPTKDRGLARAQTSSDASSNASAFQCSARLGQWQDLWIPKTKPQMQCIATPRSSPSPPYTQDQCIHAEAYDKDEDDFDLEENREHKQCSFRKRQSSSISQSDHSSQQHGAPNPLWVSLLYGLINATIVLPVLMSFASIIYREQAFQPYMARLTKLTLLSGMVHQFTFSTLSSLPFCVGQVQDAGLIFLSSMATVIVQYCHDEGLDDEALLATATVCLSLSTAVLGLGLVVIGQCGLAQYVQMLPTSVVGGYLAYIGWFCGMAGVGLMAGESEVTWLVVKEAWYLVLPGLLGGIVIYVMVRWLRHMAVLPCCILALLAAFYMALWIMGRSVEEVTEDGWIRDGNIVDGGVEEEPPKWYETWDYLKLDLVAWQVLPRLILTELSMIFVVAMSSSLDVAAIELELKRPLNYNGELKMVGLSNLISGLSMGYTGSYIFSQSIFSLRAGITSRAAGYVLASTQLAFFLLRFPVLSYVPNFFFGSLLCMICVDLMYEWLWDVRHKVTPVEYLICLSTFGLIQGVGVEFGILLGVVVYVMCYKIGLSVGEPKRLEAGEDVQPVTQRVGEANTGRDERAALLNRESCNLETTNNYGSV